MGTDIVRLATRDDLPECMIMGRRFYNESGYSDMGDFNPALTEQVLTNCIDNGTLIIGDGGMIGFIVFPIYMTGTNAAQELFWWVNHEKRGARLGLQLLKAAEARAKDIGAKAMMMLCLDRLNGEKVGKLYERLGYESREQTYMRLL